MAWFTNTTMSNALIECRKRNVSVEIIFIDDIINRSEFGIDFGILLKAGIKIRMKTAHTLMHNKFCVIDKTVITGSYNWTYFANLNDENIIISDREGLADSYIQYFHELWKTGSELPDPYKYIKWSLCLKDDFNELKRNLYRDIQAKNDINTEIKKQKIIEIDKAINSEDQQLVENAAKLPLKKYRFTIMDILVKYAAAFKYRLWKENKYGDELTDVGGYSNIEKWIFWPAETKGKFKPFYEGIVFYLYEQGIVQTSYEGIPYLKGLSQYCKDKTEEPDNVIKEFIIPLAKMFYFEFPQPMYKLNNNHKDMEKGLIKGINVFGLVKEIKENQPIFFEGWNPYIKGEQIMKTFFTT